MVPFINSGQEVFEVQPMNTGIDCTPESAFELPKNDPLYGKLALFDRYGFHYLHPRRWEMIRKVEEAAQIREKMLDVLLKPKNALPLGFSAPWDLAAGFAYPSKNKVSLVIANTDTENDKEHYIRLDNLPDTYKVEGRAITQIFSSEDHPIYENATVLSGSALKLYFKKGEVKIIELKA